MKIKRISLPDEICDRIRESIIKGEWKPGEKIPSENELSELFGVNRLTVRMALQKLSTQRILDTRIGEGTYVKVFNFSEYIGEVSDFYMKPEMIDNVCEFRKALEVECSRLAMERATPTDLEILGAACDRYDAVCSRLFEKTDLDPDILEELILADLEFHHTVVMLSKNALYNYSFEVSKESIFRYLHLILIQRLDLAGSKRELLVKACSQHRVIYEAIKAKDFETCKSAFIAMIDFKSEF